MSSCATARRITLISRYADRISGRPYALAQKNNANLQVRRQNQRMFSCASAREARIIPGATHLFDNTGRKICYNYVHTTASACNSMLARPIALILGEIWSRSFYSRRTPSLASPLVWMTSARIVRITEYMMILRPRRP